MFECVCMFVLDNKQHTIYSVLLCSVAQFPLISNFLWVVIKKYTNSKSRSFLMVRSAVITCVDVVVEVAAKHNKCNACHKIKYKEQDVEQERETGTWKGNVIVWRVPKFQLTRLLEFLAARYPWRQTADFIGPPFPLPALFSAIIRLGLFIIVFRLSVRFACWERSPVFMVPRYAVFFF